MTILNKKKLTINSLSDNEEEFKNNLVDAFGKQWYIGESVYPKAIRIYTKKDAYYYKRKTEKVRICLHATHGYLSGDVGNLSRRHVSVPYLIARNGTVYELFDPDYWSYHIGRLPLGYWCSNKQESKRTIGIELSNMGDLYPYRRNKNILLDAWSFPYCMKSNTDYYIKESYRRKKYFATYTDAQLKSLDSLLLFLCRKYDIPHSFVPLNNRSKVLKTEPKAGILSHVNYRNDKIDVSPAMDWMRISGR